LADLGWGGVEQMDYIGMDLLQGDESQTRGTQGGLEAAAVFQDVFFGVPFGEAKIEDLLSILNARAAGLGAETVDEPGEFGERGRLEDSEAARFAFRPHLIRSGGMYRQKCLAYWIAVLALGLQCFRG